MLKDTSLVFFFILLVFRRHFDFHFSVCLNDERSFFQATYKVTLVQRLDSPSKPDMYCTACFWCHGLSQKRATWCSVFLKSQGENESVLHTFTGPVPALARLSWRSFPTVPSLTLLGATTAINLLGGKSTVSGAQLGKVASHHFCNNASDRISIYSCTRICIWYSSHSYLSIHHCTSELRQHRPFVHIAWCVTYFHCWHNFSQRPSLHIALWASHWHTHKRLLRPVFTYSSSISSPTRFVSPTEKNYFARTELTLWGASLVGDSAITLPLPRPVVVYTIYPHITGINFYTGTLFSIWSW